MSYYGLSCRHDKIDQLLIFREIKIKDRDGWRTFFQWRKQYDSPYDACDTGLKVKVGIYKYTTI